MRYMNRISEIIYSKIKGRNVLCFFDLHQLKTSKNTINVQNVEKNAIHVTMINLLMCKMSCWLKKFSVVKDISTSQMLRAKLTSEPTDMKIL